MQKISLKDYLSKREELQRAQKRYRICCAACKKTKNTCYCEVLKSYAPDTKFVILIHKEEVRRTVATGRMAHLSLKNSVLLKGINFSNHEELNQLLDNPTYYCILLFPGQRAMSLSQLKSAQVSSKHLVIILLDATWHEARRMYRLSTNLHALPMVSFSPTTPSQFQVRKQPKENCYSTIESIHHVLSILEPSKNFEGMLGVFQHMVKIQLHYGIYGGGRKSQRKSQALPSSTYNLHTTV